MTFDENVNMSSAKKSYTRPLLERRFGDWSTCGIVQAATSINEMTLSFIPKLAALVLVLYLFGSWQITVLTDFASRLIERIPGIIG